MLKSYLIAGFGVATVMVFWVFVQRAWGRLFYPDDRQADALKHRISCGKCGCLTRCDRSSDAAEDQGRVSIEGSGRG